jgi:hypothetical protein
MWGGLRRITQSSMISASKTPPRHMASRLAGQHCGRMSAAAPEPAGAQLGGLAQRNLTVAPTSAETAERAIR